MAPRTMFVAGFCTSLLLVATALASVSSADPRAQEEPHAGLHARLSPFLSIWRDGETPILHLEIENRGEQSWRVPQCHTRVQLEVDGKRARVRDISSVPYMAGLAPGRQSMRIPIDLRLMILEQEGKKQKWRRERLAPGSHTIRASVVVEALRGDEVHTLWTEEVRVQVRVPRAEAPDVKPLPRARMAARNVPTSRLAFYLVRRTSISTLTNDVDLEGLTLEAAPVLDERDIVSYRWDEHSIELTERAIRRLPSPGVFGMYFVVMADGKPCYCGAFWTRFSSTMPRVPTCYPPILRPGKEEKLPRMQVSPSPGFQKHDPRSDERIRSVLEQLGKLR